MATIRGMVKKARTTIREIIGKFATVMQEKLWLNGPTIDRNRTNYRFWDNLRHGRAEGLELAGLLIKPASEIHAAWVMGETGPQAKLEESDEYTDDLLRRLMRRIRGLLATLVVDLYGLGDQFIVVNADGSFSVPSPDTVERIDDPLDYRRAAGWRIRNRFEKVDLIDEYRLDGRTFSIKNKSKDPLETEDFGIIAPDSSVTFEFPNLIGRVPVVHFANNRGTNEVFGRPMADPLYPLLCWYNDLLLKALRGANRLSNPILAFVNLFDPATTMEENSAEVGEEYVDEEGFIRNRPQVNIDEDTPVVFAGEGGDVKFVSPPRGFTEDIRNMLKSLYLLFMEHLHLPDVVMGFEMSAARASATEQIKTFFAWIENRRLMLEGEGSDDLLGVEARFGILAVIDIWLRYRSLTDRKVKVRSAMLEWPALSDFDDELTLKWADAMHKASVIRDETFVDLSGRVKDPAEEIELTNKEIEENKDRFEQDEQAIDEEDPEVVPVPEPEEEAA